ncbi:MAG: GntR family transcriptional regulator [marine benthic group bacterium]|nr:GntR family transcriptional regulator [Gemmatimonadota bacterium]
MMTGPGVLQLMSLREQVYEHLRGSIEAGALEPGTFLDQNRISADLGISRTPLRDALLQLDLEGFVEVLPRRGVRVRKLTLDDIRHLYEIIGALEGAALLSSGDALASREIEMLERLNGAMSAALDAADFDAYYSLNLDFHGVFLSRSDNEELKRTVRVCRQRLYDFPRERAFVPEWERRSIEEHAALIALIQEQDLRAAADFLRDVHWSFAIQMPFLLRYYHLDEPGGALE